MTKAKADKALALLLEQDDPLVTVLLFRSAMRSAVAGEPDLLAGMLRSDNPRGEYARASLAAYVPVKPSAKRGRKADSAVRETAEEIEFFAREVEAVRGRRAYGGPHRNPSGGKERIVQFVIDRRKEAGLPVPDRIALDNHLKRSRNSRTKKSV